MFKIRNKLDQSRDMSAKMASNGIRTLPVSTRDALWNRDRNKANGKRFTSSILDFDIQRGKCFLMPICK